MATAVKAHVAGADYFFSVAAVADYRRSTISQRRKLKKTAEPMELKLKPTEDILAYVAALPDAPFCVGFAAESENLAEYAQAKRVRKKVPMIVANLVQHTIGKEENEVTIYDDHGAHELPARAEVEHRPRIIAHAMRWTPSAIAPRPSRRSSRSHRGRTPVSIRDRGDPRAQSVHMKKLDVKILDERIRPHLPALRHAGQRRPRPARLPRRAARARARRRRS